MLWQPPNISATCPAHSELEACSAFGYFFLNLLVDLYGSSPQKTLESKEGGEYDFIVVGAGTAGCAVSNRLTEVEGWKVLLLEAGGEQPDVTRVPGFITAITGSSVDWQYKTAPSNISCLAQPNSSCSWPRGKMMGGTSSINTMTYVRGNKLDYDDWAAMGNDGWSYEDVLPFFKKAEHNLNIEGLDSKYHGVDGPQFVSRFPYIDQPSIMITEAFTERGLPIVDLNAEEQQGTMQGQAFAVNGQRYSSNDAYITPIRYKRKNLVIKTNTEVVKVLFDGNKRAYGVVYVTQRGNMYTAIARKEVIVSGGTINTPKLLMLSGLGPRKQLEDLNIPVVADLAVGENLMDQLTFDGLIVALPKNIATNISQDDLIHHVKEYKGMKYHNGPLSSIGATNSIAFLKTNPHLPAPDIQYQTNCIADWKEFVRDPILSEQLDIFPESFYNAVEMRVQSLNPTFRGQVLLNPENINGMPIVRLNYLLQPAERVSIIKGSRFLLSLEDTYAFTSRGAKFVKIPLKACKDYFWGTDEYIDCLVRQYTTSTAHLAGTSKMGPKWDTTAVVDPRLRVYGVSGLRVIDASIMPIVTRGNTNAPTLMIAEKGAEYIKEYWL